jgi:hypothetical protein
MKIYHSLLAIAILCATTTQAQKEVNIGIKAGLNYYNIGSDENSNFDPKTGFHLGLLGHIHLNRSWAFQPELVYSGQGAKFTEGGFDTRLKLGYINVPMMIQYMFNNGFRINAGPQIGFLVSAKSVTDGVDTDVKDEINTFDFSIGAGLGYIHPTTGLGASARYNLGLSNVIENTEGKYTNRGLQLSVFYQFRHK